MHDRELKFKVIENRSETKSVDRKKRCITSASTTDVILLKLSYKVSTENWQRIYWKLTKNLLKSNKESATKLTKFNTENYTERMNVLATKPTGICK